ASCWCAAGPCCATRRRGARARRRRRPSGSGHKLCKKFAAAVWWSENSALALEGRSMRGRKPRRLTLAPADVPILHGVAHSRRLAWFQVQHARIVLGVASGEPIAALAARLECDPATVWRVCRRYERGGLKALL